MLRSLRLENFKSIEKATLDFPAITLLIGPNSSGKSSVMQALAIVKNFFLNTNRPVDEFLNLGHTRLGSFTDIVWQHDTTRSVTMTLGITESQGREVEYEFQLLPGSKGASILRTKVSDLGVEVRVDFPIPYPQKEQQRKEIKINDVSNVLVWNGITLSAEIPPGGLEEFKELLKLHTDTIFRTFAVPPAGGFSNNIYSMVGVPDRTTLLYFPDSMVASILQNDADVEEKVSSHMEQIFQIRNMRTRTLHPNVALMIGRRKFASNIVNEGYGLNRIAFTLATICATPKSSIIGIEEPENHLHPAAQSRLADSLVTLAREEDKQLIISTHSEHLLFGFLTAVAEHKISSSALAVYSADLNPNEMTTTFERLEVNDQGQVKGGLRGFFETDVDTLSRALGALKANSNGDSSRRVAG